MIKVSEIAAKKIASLKLEENRPADAFLRVSVKRGGCSGFEYKMDFDETMQTNDKVFECNGQKVVVDGKSMLYLIGMQLDFEGGLNGKGFIFSNPNATKTCGCGSSFGV